MSCTLDAKRRVAPHVACVAVYSARVPRYRPFIWSSSCSRDQAHTQLIRAPTNSLGMCSLDMTPAASSPGNTRGHVSSEATFDAIGFHLNRMPSLSCEQDHGVQGQIGQVVEHHIPRGDGRATEGRAYVGGTMELSPKRPTTPPFLKGGRKSKSGSDLGLEADDGAKPSGRRRSFGDGSSMTLPITTAEIADDARACEEAKLWREQLLAAQQAPAAGASSVLLKTSVQSATNLEYSSSPYSPK